MKEVTAPDKATAKIERVTLQSLKDSLGEHRAMRACAPVAFYMLLKSGDYLPPWMQPADFIGGLDGQAARTDTKDWSRPALSRYVRSEFGAYVVSWQLNGGNNLAAMKKAGYVSDQEAGFFRSQVAGREIEAVCSEGLPVIVTVNPGFGGSGTSNIHSVIIESWANDVVRVVDSDERNPHREFSPQEMREAISHEGAGSIVAPNPLASLI